MSREKLDSRLREAMFRVREYMMEQDPAYSNLHVRIEVQRIPSPPLDGDNMSMELVAQLTHGGFVYTRVQQLDDRSAKDDKDDKSG